MASERPEKGGRLRRALGLRDRDRTPMLAPGPSYDDLATGDVRILPSASDPDVPASPPAETVSAEPEPEAQLEPEPERSSPALSSSAPGAGERRRPWFGDTAQPPAEVRPPSPAPGSVQPGDGGPPRRRKGDREADAATAAEALRAQEAVDELRDELPFIEAEWLERPRGRRWGGGPDDAETRRLLGEAEHAIERLDSGTWGVCERCGRPPGKRRLLTSPAAALCATCARREARR